MRRIFLVLAACFESLRYLAPAWLLAASTLIALGGCSGRSALSPCAPNGPVATSSPPPLLPPAIRSEERAIVPVTPADPQWGEPNAPVTLVEIADFQCPFCGRVEPTLTQLRRKYGPEKLRIVWKNNPLPFHNDAHAAAEAAMTVFALGGHDAFWKFHDNAYAGQQALSDESYASWAGQAGVDISRFKAAYGSRLYAAKVDEDMAMAASIDARGTPAFRINGVVVSGAQPLEKFVDVIDAQLDEAKLLLDSGTKPSDVYAALTFKNMVGTGAPPKKPSEVHAEEDDKNVWQIRVL
ncbi:MAG TPA: thioredoxin domain-containing protein, partial [Polyangiaceae bacterium]|nr:thioredoxin domain-containing protein [Polyangiaceae bacterium]